MRDLARQEVERPPRRLVVVEDPAAREHAVAAPVARGDEVRRTPSPRRTASAGRAASPRSAATRAARRRSRSTTPGRRGSRSRPRGPPRAARSTPTAANSAVSTGCVPGHRHERRRRRGCRPRAAASRRARGRASRWSSRSAWTSSTRSSTPARFGVGGRRPANDAENLVALLEQELGEQRAVLAADAGDERAPRSPGRDRYARGHAAHRRPPRGAARPARRRREYWGLAWSALAWLEETVAARLGTLETGAGREHASSSPQRAPSTRRSRPTTARRIGSAASARERGIDSSRVRFRVGPSHEVLPRLDTAAARPRPDRRRARLPVPDPRLVVPGPARTVGGPSYSTTRTSPPSRRRRRTLRASADWELEDAVSFRTACVREGRATRLRRATPTRRQRMGR